MVAISRNKLQLLLNIKCVNNRRDSDSLKHSRINSILIHDWLHFNNDPGKIYFTLLAYASPQRRENDKT